MTDRMRTAIVSRHRQKIFAGADCILFLNKIDDNGDDSACQTHACFVRDDGKSLFNGHIDGTACRVEEGTVRQ